jgi:hypothetical protein
VGALKDVYEVVFDLAIKVNLPTEVAKLRGKLEQLEQEHVQEAEKNNPTSVDAAIKRKGQASICERAD